MKHSNSLLAGALAAAVSAGASAAAANDATFTFEMAEDGIERFCARLDKELVQPLNALGLSVEFEKRLYVKDDISDNHSYDLLDRFGTDLTCRLGIKGGGPVPRSRVYDAYDVFLRYKGIRDHEGDADMVAAYEGRDDAMLIWMADRVPDVVEQNPEDFERVTRFLDSLEP